MVCRGSYGARGLEVGVRVGHARDAAAEGDDRLGLPDDAQREKRVRLKIMCMLLAPRSGPHPARRYVLPYPLDRFGRVGAREAAEQEPVTLGSLK